MIRDVTQYKKLTEKGGNDFARTEWVDKKQQQMNETPKKKRPLQ